MFGFDDAIAEGLKVLDKFIPDTAQRDAAKAELTQLMLTLSAQSDQAQNEVNKIEAAGNFFESGWRPFIGWTCGLAFCGHYVITPTFLFLRSCWQGVCAVPEFNMAELNSVLYALLGIGTLRTVDKSIGHIMGKIK